MATITLHGNPINTNGDLPTVGSTAPDFTLTNGELGEVSLADFDGKKKVLNIFPSIDTGICALSTKAFNEAAADYADTMFLTVSADLPFALGRFCGAEGLENVISLSDYKDGSFGKSYGVDFIDGPLEALHSRSIVVLDVNGIVQYTEQVSETVDEPNYKAALEALYNE